MRVSELKQHLHKNIFYHLCNSLNERGEACHIEIHSIDIKIWIYGGRTRSATRRHVHIKGRMCKPMTVYKYGRHDQNMWVNPHSWLQYRPPRHETLPFHVSWWDRRQSTDIWNKLFPKMASVILDSSDQVYVQVFIFLLSLFSIPFDAIKTWCDTMIDMEQDLDSSNPWWPLRRLWLQMSPAQDGSTCILDILA